MRCAPVSRSSPKRAETSYGLGGAERNRATVPASPGDANSFRNNNSNSVKNKGLEWIAVSTIPYALVVDDDPLILVQACDILEGAGFRLHEAGRGEEAKTLLADHAEDVTLLVSDVETPGETDGIALVQYVADHWPWIEIVIATAT